MKHQRNQLGQLIALSLPKRPVTSEWKGGLVLFAVIHREWWMEFTPVGLKSRGCKKRV